MSATKSAYRAIVCSAILTITACASSNKDGAGHRNLNPERIKDAVPVEEPQVRAGNPKVYTIRGKQYRTLKTHRGFEQVGYASWYGSKFHGRKTSNGESYDMYAMTAAHKTLPIPCYVRVTRQDNGKSIVVRINDRGPFVDGRIIDLSYAAAIKLGMTQSGTAKVHIEAIDVGKYRNRDIRRTAPAQPSVYSTPPTSASARSFDVPQPDKRAVSTTPNLNTGGRLVHADLPQGYFVQVAAFQTFDNSLSTLKSYRKRGLQPLLVQIETPHFPFKLWLGPHGSKEKSRAVQNQLEQQGLQPGFVVRN